MAIRGKNLASLDGEFEIDFMAEPLKSAGIFAITGQTGAGKSTILDALCLALFDNAPRLNKAELIRKEDLETLQDKISPQDCRNILRRGNGEGYAEVDFIALNGDQYRSRWTVRRARDKSDGTLQPTTVSLENLTHGVQEQGTKKDILQKITEIIGLTFDQFTRAVLLAQGDFASFLKARQNEKAELLEKLTGTEIYSRISILIYQKAMAAKNALEMIRQRIRDVRLLTEEELEDFNNEKQQLEEELACLYPHKDSMAKKLDWLKQEEQLKFQLAQAENELQVIQEKITEAAPRYEYMSWIDVSQEIRDSYIELMNKQVQTAKFVSAIESKENELKEILNKAAQIENELIRARTTLEETDAKYNALKPALTEAKELDFKIDAAREKGIELRNEINTYSCQVEKAQQNIAALKKEGAEIKKKREEISQWLSAHRNYEMIAPQISYLSSLISTSGSLKKQRDNALNGLESSKAVLHTYTQQLEQYEQETQRLNQLLPTEILTLRNKLEDGKPCPVCGSIHHLLQAQKEQQDRIAEKELESEKKRNADVIIQTKDNIEKTRKRITEFEVHIDNFLQQYDEAYNQLKESLANIPEWEADFHNGSLQEKLTNTICQWNKNKEQLDRYNQQIQNLIVRLDAENKNMDTIRARLKEKEDVQQSVQDTFNGYTEQRKQLLKNKCVEEVEAYYSDLRQHHTRLYEQCRNEREKTEKEKSVTEGTLNQLKKDQELNKREIERLETAVQEWLESRSCELSSGLLKDLMSKSHAWIQQEKSYLNELKNKKLICQTTCQERTGQLKKHMQSENKPAEEETKEILSQQLGYISEKTDTINRRLNEVKASLLIHQRGKEQIKIFEKELNEKTELHNNWAKLNDLLGSASGNKFKTIAQGYTLDVLLSYANKHLQELTQRYKLEKIAGTLALQVIDNDMLGEVRTVHSLSGGESFLISLALALGLSSLSSNRMKIESLFIDEGFGALDIDTLSIAMDALDNLQTQGRKIGVISHVEEMKERITTQIQVVKLTNGRSTIQVVG
ncbi:MAG: AAA family ATPase [Candidatus Azobacteroides sp.]|nr:AAA family ATPase [Candidatus Azobacteroides sp.]